MSSIFKMKPYLLIFLVLNLIIQCKQNKLPILGQRTFNGSDTTYATIPDWTMVDQDSQLIQLSKIQQGPHIATFFFTSCPTICPKVMRNIYRLTEQFKSESSLSFICFSMDFKRDSVKRLKEYYTKVGFDNPQLHLLRGQNKDQVLEIAKNYMSTAIEDDTAPGGYNHSGWILLVDKNKHLRSYCQGTSDQEVDNFINDVKLLLEER